MDQLCTSISGQPSLSRRRRSRRVNIVCVSLAAIASIGAACALLGNERSALASERCVGELDREYARVMQEVQQAQTLEARQHAIEQRGAMADALLQQTNSSVILARVANSLPAGISLVAMECDTQPLANGQRDSTRVTLRAVAADAASVAQLMDALRQSPLFKQTRLVGNQLGDRPGQAASQVQVEMVLNDAADNRQNAVPNAALAQR